MCCSGSFSEIAHPPPGVSRADRCSDLMHMTVSISHVEPGLQEHSSSVVAKRHEWLLTRKRPLSPLGSESRHLPAVSRGQEGLERPHPLPPSPGRI